MHDTYPQVCPKRSNKPCAQNTTVVVSRWDADTSWTQKLVEKGFRVIVYEHGTNNNSPYNLPANVGREASAYTRYIRDFYDNLTLYTVFVHDHEFSWHHEGSLVDILLHKVTSLCSPKYVNFNNRCTGDVHNDLWPMTKSFFNKYLKLYLGPISTYGNWTLGNRCCAQFLVHRDRIRRHPRKMYVDMYKYFIANSTTDPIGLARGHMFEWCASLIFDSPILYPRAPQKHTPGLSGGPCYHAKDLGIKSKALGTIA